MDAFVFYFRIPDYGQVEMLTRIHVLSTLSLVSLLFSLIPIWKHTHTRARALTQTHARALTQTHIGVIYIPTDIYIYTLC